MYSNNFNVLNYLEKIKIELREHLDKFDWGKMNYVALRYLQEKDKCSEEELTCLSKLIVLSGLNDAISYKILNMYLEHFEYHLMSLRWEIENEKNTSKRRRVKKNNISSSKQS